MENANQKSCQCQKTSCGCASVQAPRCTCGETCNCQRVCNCAGGCGCANPK